MAKILIVDDDPQLRQSFEKMLEAEGHTPQTASNGAAGIDAVTTEPPDLVIMDIRMPGMTGLEAFNVMHAHEPRLPIIIMTAYGTTETAIEATKMGAFDYILKPFEIPDILDLIDKALKVGRFVRTRVMMDAQPESASGDAIIGRSQPMQEIYKAIGRAAPTDATVLICGESGTGKELVSRAIYQHSTRSDKAFQVINCVAIPETLLESELFGYEKGAFTGAVSRRIGKIEQAHRGTIFLDEIGDMPFSIQAKILRLLQEKSIERLGGRQPIPVNVRIIAATNRNLEEEVSRGRFREDLYYRLNVVSLRLPPLRDRKDDIPLLADYFLKGFSREMNVINPGISDAGINTMTCYAWPGNVRELANTLQKALIFSSGAELDKTDIQRAIGENTPVLKADDKPEDMETMLKQWIQYKFQKYSDDHLFDYLMDYFARIITGEALSITDGNRTKAARLLGLSRPTLLAKIDKYNLKTHTEINAFVPEDE